MAAGKIIIVSALFLFFLLSYPAAGVPLQIPFIENQGQINEKVRFYAATFAGTVFVTEKGEIVYSLIKESLVYSERLEIKGIGKAETEVNYFVGGKDAWRAGIPTWHEVSLGEVYEGIELKLKAYEKNVEKVFTVHPHASVGDIKLKVEGAKWLIVKDGELEVGTEFGIVKFTKPVAYQDINGKRIQIPVAYVVSRFEYGFQVGEYDRAKPLVIDPALAYSTYLGGSSAEYGYGVAVDSSGNMYVTGKTNSTNFPTASPLNASNAGDYDIFVTKINSSGTGLVYSTYLGGNDSDSSCGSIAIDSSGNVYLTGFTYSDDFPTTASPLQGSRAGDRDAYVTKINSSGSGLVYSTYLGGSGFDWPCGWSIAVDSSENAYIVGETNSTNFPIASPLQASNAGGYDVFVTKVNASGTGLVYSTYLGGSLDDASWSIAVDSSGNVYIPGYTNSANFPTASPLYGDQGGMDVFITKINSSGTGLVYSTYLGGSGTDYAHGIAVDSSGNAHITGRTSSTNFPTASPLQASNGGGTDAFVTKINSSGSGLVYSTYLGGSGYDYGWGIVADSFGNAHLTGYTESANFPTASQLYGDAGGRDAFVTEINPSGSLIHSTYLGGSGTDEGWDIAADSSGNVYVVGRTNSTDFPTASPLYASNAGGYDAFVTKIDLAPHITIDSPLNQTYNQTSVWANVTLNENASWCGYSLNGAGNQTMNNLTGNLTFFYASVSMPDGYKNITVYCNDTVGSVSNQTVYFTVDTGPLNITIKEPRNMTYEYTNQIRLHYSTTSSLTGDERAPDTARYSINSTGNVSITGTYLLSVSGGSSQQNITIWANNTAGNMSSATIYFTVSVFNTTNAGFTNVSSSGIWINGTVNATNSTLYYSNFTGSLNLTNVTIENCTVENTNLTNVTVVHANISSGYIQSLPDRNASIHTVKNNVWINFTHVYERAAIDGLILNATKNASVNASGRIANVYIDGSAVAAIDLTANGTIAGSLDAAETALNPGGVALAQRVGNYLYLSNSSEINSSNAYSIYIKRYYTDAELASSGFDETRLYMSWYNPSSGWEQLLSTMDWVYDTGRGSDASGKYVYANVSHFSTYAISGSFPPSPEHFQSGGPSPVIGSKGGAVDVPPTQIKDIILEFGYQGKQFYAASPMLYGVLGALDAFPISYEQESVITSISVNPVKTLAGDVYALAAEQVLAKHKKIEGYKKVPMVIVARGDLGVDAIASVAYARALGVPILLAAPDEIPSVTQDVLEKLSPTSVIIVGGKEAISNEVEAKLPIPRRIGGKGRHETAVLLASALISVKSVDTAVITDGEKPSPEAVMLAVKYGAPILYTSGDELPPETKALLQKHKSISRIVMVGISSKAKAEVDAIY